MCRRAINQAHAFVLAWDIDNSLCLVRDVVCAVLCDSRGSARTCHIHIYSCVINNVIPPVLCDLHNHWELRTHGDLCFCLVFDIIRAVLRYFYCARWLRITASAAGFGSDDV